jgi:hypothetical protein
MFAQSRDVFMCDFINAMKMCQLEIYWFYKDPYNKFDDLAFDELSAFETFNNKNLPMSWEVDLNGEEADCLVIEFSSSKYFMNQHCLVTSDVKLVLRPDFPKVLAHVKSYCDNSIKSFGS